jgi:hypothetical protein
MILQSVYLQTYRRDILVHPILSPKKFDKLKICMRCMIHAISHLSVLQQCMASRALLSPSIYDVIQYNSNDSLIYIYIYDALIYCNLMRLIFFLHRFIVTRRIVDYFQCIYCNSPHHALFFTHVL